MENRKMPELQTTTYGMALAEKVADGLKYNSIGYSHRDYCGMGLNYHDGTYNYGELWDGYMMKPSLQWSSTQSFVQWLAQQSDASCGRLEESDQFYWGNQTITRQRLMAFLV